MMEFYQLSFLLELVMNKKNGDQVDAVGYRSLRLE